MLCLQSTDDEGGILSKSLIFLAITLIAWSVPIKAQKSAGPLSGTLIVDGGGASESVRPYGPNFTDAVGMPFSIIVGQVKGM